MEPNEPKPPRDRSRWRLVLLPFAFAWLFAMVCAPIELIDERVMIYALVAGFAVGLAFLALTRNAKPLGEATVERPAQPVRALPPAQRIAPTLFSVLLAVYAGVCLATNSIKDRSPIVIIAVLLVIDLVRRPLRRAWGVGGSFAGIALAGALLVLMVRSASIGGNSKLEVMLISALLLTFDIFDEWRALSRAGLLNRRSDTE